MKKIIFISIAVTLLGLASYFFIIKKSANRELIQSLETIVDTNDNLEEAFKDLEQLE